MIVPAEDGRLSILLNRGITQGERRNFSICHEIAHTFFPDCAEFVRMREKMHEKVFPLSERFRASKTAIIIKMVSSGKRVCVPDDSCVYVVVGTNEVTNGREDWGIQGHPVYDVEAMYLPPFDGNDLTPRAVALVMPATYPKYR